jgi:hypothetical protein
MVVVDKTRDQTHIAYQSTLMYFFIICDDVCTIFYTVIY